MRDVYFEFTRVGRVRKVCAIDSRTGIEISMVWAPGYSQRMIERLAMQKLAYVIRKQRENAEDAARQRPSGVNKSV